MTSELIKTKAVTIGNELQQAVSARELWKFLEAKQEFANWFSNRVNDCGFVEGRDFCLIILSSKDGRGGHNRKEYAITLDMAKHLAMMERNERGRQAREYFIEVEKRTRNAEGIAAAVVATMTPIIRENERLRASYEFSRHFLPSGNPGDLNKDGVPKTQFRRGYYTSGAGRSIMALVERSDQPGLFDEIELKAICNLAAGDNKP